MKFLALYCEFHSEIDSLSASADPKRSDAKAIRHFIESTGRKKSEFHRYVETLHKSIEDEKTLLFDTFEEQHLSKLRPARFSNSFRALKARRLRDRLGREIRFSSKASGHETDLTVGLYLETSERQHSNALELHSYIWRRGGKEQAEATLTELEKVLPVTPSFIKGWYYRCPILSRHRIKANQSCNDLIAEVMEAFDQIDGWTWKRIASIE